MNMSDLKKTLYEASNSYQLLLQQTYNEALSQNEMQTKRWQSYKREHEELSGRLLSLRDKLAHTIMVPLGNKALMRGNLVHTNEILVCLGDGWFAKQTAQQAAEICQRRIQHCDEILRKLQKEEELLISRRSFSSEFDTFGGDQTQELIEPYDEEAEKQWRERHRQKENDYHQKLAELRKSQNKKIKTEEDLWSRLDALDLQEELEDELNRMDKDAGNEGDSPEDGSEDDSEDGSDSSSDQEACTSQIERSQDEDTKTLKRRVSFKEDKKGDNGCEENRDSDDDLICIRFKHSDAPSYCQSQEAKITSPADIYTQYLTQKVPKSILKQSPTEEYHLLPERSVTSRHVKEVKRPEEPVVKAVGEEVVERTTSVPSVVPCERPVSRFKAARMASKR